MQSLLWHHTAVAWVVKYCLLYNSLHSPNWPKTHFSFPQWCVYRYSYWHSLHSPHQLRSCAPVSVNSAAWWHSLAGVVQVPLPCRCINDTDTARIIEKHRIGCAVLLLMSKVLIIPFDCCCWWQCWWCLRHLPINCNSSICCTSDCLHLYSTPLTCNY